MNISELQKECWQIADDHGFHGKKDTLCQERIAYLALIGSEVGEAVEAARKGDENNLAEELADIVIRVMDFAEICKIDLDSSIRNKMQVNKKRPYMHGKLA